MRWRRRILSLGARFCGGLEAGIVHESVTTVNVQNTNLVYHAGVIILTHLFC